MSSISGTYNGSSASGSFGYDANGNMTSDGLRGLTVTYFDELDLPKQYYQNSTNKVDYTYDAGGIKWSKTATVSGTASTTLYDGTFIYENGILKKVLTSEGYYDPSAGRYYYYLKDHLGNTRLTFHYSGTTAVVDQEVEYYPFGSMFTENNLDKNKYLYNGKELSDEFFENYDYGARFYDPELGRWHVADPMAEKYLSISPYAYCANNPISLIDPDGMTIAGDTTAVKQVESQAQRGVTSEQNRQSRLQAKATARAGKGKSTDGIEKRIARSEFREGQYQSTINEIGALRNSSTVYNVNTNYTSTISDGNTEYAGQDANGNSIININVSQAYAKAGGLAHELVHGYQFETGQIDFQSTGSPGILYDITDEIAAFTRQLAFTNNSQMYNVSASYVRGLKNQAGNLLYSGLPSGPLNVNSTQALIELHVTGRFNLLNNAPYKNLILPYTPIYK